MAKKRKETNISTRFHNNLLERDYSDMTVQDNRLWYGVLALAADKNQKRVVMDIEEFKELTGIPKSKGYQFVRDALFKMTQKIQAKTVYYGEREDGSEVLMWFFDMCSINPKTQQIEISVNKNYTNEINNFKSMGNFTKFEMRRYVSIPSRGMQELFTLICREKYKSEGVYISIKELKARLGKENERDRNITERIVKPALKFFEENEIFDGECEMEKVYRGRKLIGYFFTFTDKW